MQRILKRIRKIFENTEAEVIFLMNTNVEDSNFLYLTEFKSGIFEGNPLIITKKGLVLPVSPLEYEIAKEEGPKGMKIIKISSRKKMDDTIKKYLKGKVVGINASFLPYGYYKRVKKMAMPKKIIDVSKGFYNARSVKDEWELSNIRKANVIAKSALSEAREELRTGISEREVAARIEYLMVKKGANGIAFKSIVAFDSNSAMPHHMPGDARLKPNGIVLIDIGARYNNYCSDITRTFLFKPDKSLQKYLRFMEMHKIVKEAQAIGYRAVRAGVLGSDAHKAAEEHINSAMNGRYKGKFIHSLGHAIGLDVHDMGPGLRPGEKESLKTNMVVSDEPGIYVPGFGGVRIEDDLIVKENGAVFI
jgi:Xaa-Pro dipeptidase